jgi:hypothetical protein
MPLVRALRAHTALPPVRTAHKIYEKRKTLTFYSRLPAQNKKKSFGVWILCYIMNT